jgi:predicted acyl esterase
MRTAVLLLASLALSPLGARGASEPCAETPRLPSDNPVFEFQRRSFGFHDEELILCSDGGAPDSAIHIAARLWVPAECPGVGGCAGVVIGHGLGFSKETTFADMLAVVRLGMYALSYDVRGQGLSGGQAGLLSREDIADQAAVLRWWHANVRPTKTAFYGISQGGWLSWTAAEFNCGAARAAHYDSSIPCDTGGRWIDAIAPMQSPMRYVDDGTCSAFGFETFVYSRGNPEVGGALVPCATESRVDGVPGAFIDVLNRLGRVDVPVYAVSSFYDRLVSPKIITLAYERLRARTLDRNDVLFGRDVRLTLSNDAHGSVGGNLAVTGDVFAWFDSQINGGPALRAAPVAISQEWSSDAFRLERSWPIAGASGRTYYLGRDAGGGVLAASPVGSGKDELRNVPVVASPPEVPFANTAVPIGSGQELPDMRLVYATTPLANTIEITGEPTTTFWVSSSNAAAQGVGQLHVFLSEVSPDGSVTTFSQAVRGLRDLGPQPRRVTIPLSLAAHRVDSGNRLVLSIAPSDVLVVIPAHGPDPFFVGYGGATPSSLFIPVVPVNRTPPPGQPPAGAAYTDDPLGAICDALGLPCP